MRLIVIVYIQIAIFVQVVLTVMFVDIIILSNRN